MNRPRACWTHVQAGWHGRVRLATHGFGDHLGGDKVAQLHGESFDLLEARPPFRAVGPVESINQIAGDSLEQTPQFGGNGSRIGSTHRPSVARERARFSSFML